MVQKIARTSSPGNNLANKTPYIFPMITGKLTCGCRKFVENYSKVELYFFLIPALRVAEVSLEAKCYERPSFQPETSKIPLE